MKIVEKAKDFALEIQWGLCCPTLQPCRTLQSQPFILENFLTGDDVMLKVPYQISFSFIVLLSMHVHKKMMKEKISKINTSFTSTQCSNFHLLVPGLSQMTLVMKESRSLHNINENLPAICSSRKCPS